MVPNGKIEKETPAKMRERFPIIKRDALSNGVGLTALLRLR
jgi:hypothetical protein